MCSHIDWHLEAGLAAVMAEDIYDIEYDDEISGM
jgi:hypothetical protein